MNLRSALPSSHFISIVSSLALAALLIFAADRLTAAPQQSGTLAAVATSTAPYQDNNWQATLYEIQGGNASSSLPTPASPETIDRMLAAAKSDNVTDTISKSLYINLANAKSQGMGDDIPTQNNIVADALSRISMQPVQKTYTQSDITVVDVSRATEKQYGNQVMSVLHAHTVASMQQTLLAISMASDQHSDAPLAQLKPIAHDYQALTDDLAKIPVPQTLVPFHLLLLNNYAKLTATYADMGTFIADPIRGLSGLQRYKSLTDETVRVFTNIAQAFAKDGILFTKDEPGAGWSALSSQS